MSLLGRAALAMWWDMDPGMAAEFEHWHTHEHFPERLAVPGFLRASRWKDARGGDGFFVMYELESHDTLSSPEYLARLNAPTPWSQRLMPYHSNMVRCQCVVLESAGGGQARHALTLRLSPVPGHDAALRASLRGLIDDLAMRPGFGGCHLLQTRTPQIAPTVEQAIRGHADTTADWIFIACAYDEDALASLLQDELRGDALVAAGAKPGAAGGLYTLSMVMVPQDTALQPR